MKRLVKFLILFFLLLLTSKVLFSQSSTYWYSYKYTDIVAAAKEVGYSEIEINYLFSSSRMKFYPNIHEIFRKARKMERDTTSNVYLNFLELASIRAGRNFLKEHLKLLEEVEKENGIPKEVIVALFRVESNFGNYQGKYQTFGVLNSIVYYGDPSESRTRWGKEHLIKFLKFHKNMEGYVSDDIFTIYSSYAGALGIPQFLPSNYEQYAVDGDGDGRIDLFGSFADAAWSSANLLIIKGWRENKRKALYGWNRSTKFVNCILEYSERIK